MASEVVDFTVIHVNIPAKLLQKEFGKHTILSSEKYVKIKQKSAQIDKAIMQLQHARSVVEKLLLRHPY